MSTPDYHDKVSRIGDLLRYPRRVIIQALEDGFSNPQFYMSGDQEGENEEEVLNPFLYKRTEDGEDTAKDSRLEIADTWTEELNSKDPRPIIICRRGPMSFADSSIAGLKNQDAPWGKHTTFSDFVTVPIDLLCFARKDVESEELALVAALFMRLFRRKHLQNTRFQKMGSPVIGTTTPVSTDSRVEVFSTPVSFPVYLTLVWKFTEKDLVEPTGFDINVNVGST